MKIFIIIILIIVICLLECLTEIHLIKKKHYSIDKMIVPKSLWNKRIVLITDLHGKNFGKNNRRLLKKISEISADAVLISGDLLTEASKKEMKIAESFLDSLIDYKLPVYYVFGNHEINLFEYDNERYNSYLKIAKEKTHLINDDYIDLFDNVRLYGYCIPTQYYKGRNIEQELVSKHLAESFESPDKKYYNILLAHDPYFFKAYSEFGFDLILSGHVHGGIIRIPSLGGIISPRYELFPRYDKGLYNLNNSRMILSGGLGWHAIPCRFLNIPELVIIDFT